MVCVGSWPKHQKEKKRVNIELKTNGDHYDAAIILFATNSREGQSKLQGQLVASSDAESSACSCQQASSERKICIFVVALCESCESPCKCWLELTQSGCKLHLQIKWKYAHKMQARKSTRKCVVTYVVTIKDITTISELNCFFWRCREGNHTKN